MLDGVDSDEQLYARVRRGDLAAFDELYERYDGPLFGFLRATLGNHRHIWGIPCRPCDAISADRDESAALVEAVRDAAGDRDMSAVTS